MRGRTNISTFLGWSGENGIPNTNVEAYVWETLSLGFNGVITAVKYIEEIGKYIAIGNYIHGVIDTDGLVTLDESVNSGEIVTWGYVFLSDNGESWENVKTFEGSNVTDVVYKDGKVIFLLTEKRTHDGAWDNRYFYNFNNIAICYTANFSDYYISSLDISDLSNTGELLDLGDKFLVIGYDGISRLTEANYRCYQIALYTLGYDLTTVDKVFTFYPPKRGIEDNVGSFKEWVFRASKNIVKNNKLYMFFTHYGAGDVSSSYSRSITVDLNTFTASSETGVVIASQSSRSVYNAVPLDAGDYIYIASENDVGGIYKTANGSAYEKISSYNAQTRTVVKMLKYNDMYVVFVNLTGTTHSNSKFPPAYGIRMYYMTADGDLLFTENAPYVQINSSLKFIDVFLIKDKIFVCCEGGMLLSTNINRIDTTLEFSPQRFTQVKQLQKEDYVRSIKVKAVSHEIDVNIKPENIKKGVAILGVIGTYEGEV